MNTAYYTLKGLLTCEELEQAKLDKVISVLTPDAWEADSTANRARVSKAAYGADIKTLKRIAKLLGVELKNNVATQEEVAALVEENKDNNEKLDTILSIINGTYKTKKVKTTRPVERLTLPEVYAACFCAVSAKVDRPKGISLPEMVKMVYTAIQVAKKTTVMRMASVCGEGSKFYGDIVPNGKHTRAADGTITAYECYKPLTIPAETAKVVKGIYSSICHTVPDADLLNGFKKWTTQHKDALTKRKVALEKAALKNAAAKASKK